MNVTFDTDTERLVFTNDDDDVLFEAELFDRGNEVREFMVPGVYMHLFNDGFDYLETKQKGSRLEVLVNCEDLFTLLEDKDQATQAVSMTTYVEETDEGDDEPETGIETRSAVPGRRHMNEPVRPDVKVPKKQTLIHKFRQEQKSNKSNRLNLYGLEQNLKNAIVDNDDDIQDRLAVYVKAYNMSVSRKLTSHSDEIRSFIDENQHMIERTTCDNPTYINVLKDNYDHYKFGTLRAQVVNDMTNMAERFSKVATQIEELADDKTLSKRFVEYGQQCLKPLLYPLKDNLKASVINGSSERDFDHELTNRTDLYVKTVDVYNAKRLTTEQLNETIATVREYEQLIDDVEQNNEIYDEAMKDEDLVKIEHGTNMISNNLIGIADRARQVAQTIYEKTEDLKLSIPFNELGWRCLEALQPPPLVLKDYDKDRLEDTTRTKFNRTRKDGIGRVREYLNLEQAIRYMSDLAEFRHKHTAFITGKHMFPKRSGYKNPTVRELLQETVDLHKRHGLELEFKKDRDPFYYRNIDLQDALKDDIYRVL